MPGGSGDYKDKCDEIDEHDIILTASSWSRPASELYRFDLGASEVDGY